jgi:hypothetical protein
MTADKICMPTLIFPDRLVRASFAGSGLNRHRLGGPLELEIKKWPRRYPPPHRVLTLDTMDPALDLDIQRASPIPLIYGFQLSGCRMKYKLTRSDDIEIQECQGQLAKNWPYADYPPMLPTVPLFFKSSEPIDWKKLEQDEDWSGLTNQDSRPKKDEILIVVPPNDVYGVSLWGWSGDRNGVQVVFRVNLNTLAVEAWNECA